MTFELQADRIARMELEVLDLQLQFDSCEKADKFRIGLTLNLRENSLEYVRELSMAGYARADLDTRAGARPQDECIEWYQQHPPGPVINT